MLVKERLKMNYDVSKDTLAIKDVVFDGCKEIPVDLDFSLPDYCPDIQKILKCRVCPNISSRNISGDRLNIEGVAKVRVIYLDSESNKIRCCENTVPFSCSIDIRTTPENAFAVTSVRVEYVNCRAVSPRKLDIHGSFSICAKIYNKKNLNISSCVGGKDIQQKITDMKINNLIGIGQQQFSLSEVLEVDNDKASPETILNSDVWVTINDYKNMANKIVIKGEAIIKILYVDDISSGHTETLEYSIPISQIVDVPGVDENSKCVISAQVLSHEEQVSSENEDRPNFVSCEIKLVATVSAYMVKDVSLVSDAYSTDYDLEVLSEAFKINQFSDVIDETISHKDNITLTDTNLSKVIDAWIDNPSVKCTFEDGKILFKCKASVCIFAMDNEETPVYIERILEFPYDKEYESDTDCIECDVKLIPMGISCSISSANGLEVKMNFRLLGEVDLCEKYNMVTDVIGDESKTVDKDTASLAVYYATEGENVWDIARKYYTSAKMIKEENDLSDDKIRNNGMLLIPMK